MALLAGQTVWLGVRQQNNMRDVPTDPGVPALARREEYLNPVMGALGHNLTFHNTLENVAPVTRGRGQEPVRAVHVQRNGETGETKKNFLCMVQLLELSPHTQSLSHCASDVHVARRFSRICVPLEEGLNTGVERTITLETDHKLPGDAV